ncbi:MAG TPA: hypothetical protein PKE25_00810, partial [Novosphingobium sp.]|nr:hypothetical protein [Novosphingobium sp.]
APATFYDEDLSAGRPVSRYEGLQVDFLADAITAIGAGAQPGFASYNLANPHDDGVSLDNFVDWMIEAGCQIERIPSYSQWLARCETAMNALPEDQRNQSMLTILGPWRHPQTATAKGFLPVARFSAAAQAAGYPVRGLTPAMIHKYVADLRHLGLLA